MKHTELRKHFLEFFKSKDHTVVPSDSLVPAGDPTLLFTSAGMNQFKEQFLGNIKGFRKAASCQKCLRTADLENVGRTAYHHSFFEMLGNFSFGDYFKKEAISWAWEFMRDVLNIPEEKLWVSVYIEDDEAYNIWKDIVKVPKEKIIKLGQKENFWPSEAKTKGPNGPCGPCSEIFYDYGKTTGCGKKDCTPACDCGRFVEVWNLVFTQFNRGDDGTLDALPNKNIDTGMGLERLCAVMQGVRSNFDTDLFTPITAAIKNEISQQSRDTNNEIRDTKVYAIADHIRAASFAIADGITPSNEERGYVIRNVIRKAVLHGRELGIEKPFLYKLVYTVGKVMEEPYPEILKRHQDISQVIKFEEERFAVTLKDGLRLLEETIKAAKDKKVISGEAAFKLFDTHGLPIMIVKEVAHREGISVDEAGFEEFMQRQREQSRKTSQMHAAVFVDTGIREKTEFIGYDTINSQTKVIRILDEKGNDLKQADKKSGKIDIILDKSVFYGKSGGQLGDIGTLSSKGLLVKVNDAKKVQDAILLEAEVCEGRLQQGDIIEASVDTARRLAIAKNHTATHLLQAALRKVLGEHVQQQGSLVAPDRLRFDFTHFKALTKEELDRTEELVNQYIKENLAVEVSQMGIEEAKRSGALAFFGEKYEQRVRVVSAGSLSRELCGGTHLKNTSEIGLFKITSESSIASGIRRIEAVTGDSAYKLVKEHEALILSIADTLKCRPDEVLVRCQRLSSELDTLNKRLSSLLTQKIAGSVDKIIAKAQDLKGAKLIIEQVEGANADILKQAAAAIKSRLKENFVIFLAQAGADKINMMLLIADEQLKKGMHAGKIISDIAKAVGGSGGGSPNMASAGAKDITRIGNLLKEADNILTKEIR